MGINARECGLQIKILFPFSLPIPGYVEQEINMYENSEESRNICCYTFALKWHPSKLIPYICVYKQVICLQKIHCAICC